MTRLTPVSWDILVQKLRNMTFEGPYRGGKHYFMLKDDFWKELLGEDEIAQVNVSFSYPGI